MPSSISKSRLRRAFDEGRRSAAAETAANPYDNPKLRQLWEEGRAMQRAGGLKTPIPALAHGKTRAQQVSHNAAGSKAASRPPKHPRGGGGGRTSARPRYPRDR